MAAEETMDGRDGDGEPSGSSLGIARAAHHRGRVRSSHASPSALPSPTGRCGPALLEGTGASSPARGSFRYRPRDHPAPPVLLAGTRERPHAACATPRNTSTHPPASTSATSGAETADPATEPRRFLSVPIRGAAAGGWTAGSQSLSTISRWCSAEPATRQRQQPAGGTERPPAIRGNAAESGERPAEPGEQPTGPRRSGSRKRSAARRSAT